MASPARASPPGRRRGRRAASGCRSSLVIVPMIACAGTRSLPRVRRRRGAPDRALRSHLLGKDHQDRLLAFRSRRRDHRHFAIAQDRIVPSASKGATMAELRPLPVFVGGRAARATTCGGGPRSSGLSVGDPRPVRAVAAVGVRLSVRPRPLTGRAMPPPVGSSPRVRRRRLRRIAAGSAREPAPIGDGAARPAAAITAQDERGLTSVDIELGRGGSRKRWPTAMGEGLGACSRNISRGWRRAGPRSWRSGPCVFGAQGAPPQVQMPVGIWPGACRGRCRRARRRGSRARRRG